MDRIENLFAKLDVAKDLVQSALDSFENRKAAILHKAFTGTLIGATPPLVPLREITDEIEIGPFGTMLHAEEYIEAGIPVVNPKHSYFCWAFLVLSAQIGAVQRRGAVFHTMVYASSRD